MTIQEFRQLQTEIRAYFDADPCWEGYEAIGFKRKGGKRVPNCVPRAKVDSGQPGKKCGEGYIEADKKCSIGSAGSAEEDPLARKIRERTEKALRGGLVKRQVYQMAKDSQRVKDLEDDAIAQTNQHLEELKSRIGKFTTEKELDKFDPDKAAEQIQRRVLAPIVKEVAAKYPKEDFDTVEDLVLYDEKVLPKFHAVFAKFEKHIENALDKRADKIL